MKIALGTAQFGLDYGISNESGIVNNAEVTEILAKSRSCGIDTVDTAISYGSSETVLGAVGVSGFKVVSKLPPIPRDTKDVLSWVSFVISQSLDRLGLASLYGLLLHHPEDLFGQHGRDLLEALRRLKNTGLVEKLGASIYDPRSLHELTDLMDLDLVQAPFNLLDRRILASGWLDKLHKNGVEIHCRSPFLQGLLLMPRKEIPRKFEKWAKAWDFWDKSTNGNLDIKIAHCLAFASSIEAIDRVVVGVQNCRQLERLVVAQNSVQPFTDLSSLITNDENLIDPSRWVDI